MAVSTNNKVKTHLDMAAPSPGASLILPRFGLGTATLGNLYQAMPDTQAEATLRAAQAIELGYWDTAPYYGFGLSEKRIGTYLAQEPDTVPILSSKVGRVLEPCRADGRLRHGFASQEPFQPRFDYSYDGVMRSFESSLARLGVDRIPVLLAHDLGQRTHGAEHALYWRQFVEGGYRAMCSLKSQGLVDLCGLGANETEVGLLALSELDIDCFLLAGRYSLLDQSAAEAFLPACARAGVQVILGGVFNSGILVQGPQASTHYDYAAPDTAILKRAEALHALCARFDVPLAAAALHFVQRHPAVSSILVGLSSAEEVQALDQWRDVNVPEALWTALQHEGLIDVLEATA